MDGVEHLSPVEVARLTRLRERRLTGIWPPFCQETFASRYGLTMTVLPEPVTLPDRTIYRCTLNRDRPDKSSARFVLRFQVTAGYPTPPGIDEVLRWMGTAAAHVAVDGDLSTWASLHGLTATGGVSGAPYRGLVRDAHSGLDFAVMLAREASQLRHFLGPAAYAELLATVDAI